MVKTKLEDITFVGPTHPALRFCQELMDQKAHDYSGGRTQDFARRDYHPYGDISYMQMLHTKWMRVQAMFKLKADGGEPNFESLQDSVTDLINYAAFYWAYLEEEKNVDRGV